MVDCSLLCGERVAVYNNEHILCGDALWSLLLGILATLVLPQRPWSDQVWTASRRLYSFAYNHLSGLGHYRISRESPVHLGKQ
jgi:hypothetical protein